MSEGTNVPHILTAIRAVMAEVTGVTKSGEMTNRKGEHQYNYVRSAELVGKIGAAFRAHGVMTQSCDLGTTVVQAPVSGGSGSVMWTTVVVELTYKFTSLHDFSTVEFAVAGEGRDPSDKSTAKAMTMAYKSALQQAFSIATDEKDPDAERPESFQEHRHTPPPPDTRTDAQRKAEEEYARRRAGGPVAQDVTGPDVRAHRDYSTPESRDARRTAETPAQQARQQAAPQNRPADPDPVATAAQVEQGDPNDPNVQAGRVLATAARETVQADLRGESRHPSSDAQRARALDCLRAASATTDRAMLNKIVLRAAQEDLLTLNVNEATVGAHLAAIRGTVA